MSLSRLFAREFRPMLRMLEEGPFARPLYYPFRDHGRSGLHDPFMAFSKDITPAVDVAESADSYVLHAELPGIKKENINIRVGDEGRSLSINGRVSIREDGNQAPGSASETQSEPQSAEPQSESETHINKAETVQKPLQTQLYSERTFVGDMDFSRTVHLPYPVDTRGVVAKLEDGVLTIKANKLQQQGTVTSIPIE